MLKSLSKFKRQNKEKFKMPHSVQDTIPIDTVYRDGVFSVGKRFSKTYRFTDINYSDASGEDKKGILLGYGEMLNSLDASCTAKITILNRKVDPEEISKKILIDEKEDELNDLRKAYNNLIIENLAKSDNLIQEKYITITTFKNNITEARTFFSRISLELSSYFGKIDSDCTELTTNERLKILHDFYRDPYEPFVFDIDESTMKGHSFKEKICPNLPQYENKYFRFDEKYGRVLYLERYPQYLKDKFIAEICGLNKNLIYTMDILTIPTDEAEKKRIESS